MAEEREGKKEGREREKEEGGGSERASEIDENFASFRLERYETVTLAGRFL